MDGGTGASQQHPRMDGWRRLGVTMAAERGRRWRSRAAFARHAGVSRRVVDDLERGLRTNYADRTLAAVEAGLGWAPGSLMRVVQGGKPRREVDPVLAELLDMWPQLSPDARAMLVDLAGRALGR